MGLPRTNHFPFLPLGPIFRLAHHINTKWKISDVTYLPNMSVILSANAALMEYVWCYESPLDALGCQSVLWIIQQNWWIYRYYYPCFSCIFKSVDSRCEIERLCCANRTGNMPNSASYRSSKGNYISWWEKCHNIYEYEYMSKVTISYWNRDRSI